MIPPEVLGALAAAGGEWDPRSIGSSPACDLDPRFNRTLSGSTVTAWADSGKGLAYSFDPDGSTPAYEATGWVGTRRTLPAITTTTLSDNFTCTNTVGGIALANRLFGGTDQPGTVIIVHQLLTLGADDYVILAFNKVGLNATTERTIHIAAANLADHQYRMRKRDDAHVNKVPLSTCGLDTSKHILHLVSDGTTVELWRDGVSVMTSGPEDWNVGLCTFDRVQLSFSDTNAPCDQRLGRVLFYPDAFDSQQVADSYAGLNHTYG